MLATLQYFRDPPEDDPDGEPKAWPIFGVLEMICVLIFTVEYVMRISTCHAVRAELLNTDVLLDMVLGDIPIVFQTRLQRLVSFVTSPANLVDLV